MDFKVSCIISVEKLNYVEHYEQRRVSIPFEKQYSKLKVYMFIPRTGVGGKEDSQQHNARNNLKINA